MRYATIILALALAVLAGCTTTYVDGDCSKNYFGLTKWSYTIGQEASDITITAKADWWTIYVREGDKNLLNRDFEVVCLEEDCTGKHDEYTSRHRLKITGDWFEIAETSKKELSVSVAENKTGEVRNLEIHFNSGNCNDKITVTQKAE